MQRFLAVICLLSLFSAAALARDWGDYYPLRVGNVLYFDGLKKENNENCKVRMEVMYKETRDNREYFYLYAPSVDIRYLLRKDAEGVYMQYIKIPFPVISFIMVEAEMKPEMKFVSFPLQPGAKWSHEGTATVYLFGFIPIERKIKAYFKTTKRETLKTGAGPIDTYCIEVLIDTGDGKGLVKETHWYGMDVGYTAGETVIYRALLAGRNIITEEGNSLDSRMEGAEGYR